MEGKRFRVGSIAVLFAVVVLCVAIFCILTVVTAMADARTANQYGKHMEQVYHCQALGEEWLAEADAYFFGAGAIPEDSVEEENILTTQILDEPICLWISVEKDGSSCRIVRWDCTTQWEADQSWTLLQTKRAE